jgi:hypothetical protein
VAVLLIEVCPRSGILSRWTQRTNTTGTIIDRLLFITGFAVPISFLSVDFGCIIIAIGYRLVLTERNLQRFGGAGLADDRPAPGIEGRIERERSTAIIFKAVPFSPTCRKAAEPNANDPPLERHPFRRHEHCGAERRLEVPSDDIGCLLCEFWAVLAIWRRSRGPARDTRPAF